MSKRTGTDQGRHLAALRDRARRPDLKDRSGRGAEVLSAIERFTDEEGIELSAWQRDLIERIFGDAEEGDE